LLAQIVGRPTLRVNSCHHQAVKSLSLALRATATSPDGVIEAMELEFAVRTAHPFTLAVQFHPERLFQSDPSCAKMFKAFVAACLQNQLS
jgi:putative glutamine amidotransferase